MPAHEHSAGPTPQQSRILWNALTALAVIALLGVAGLVFLGFISFLSWSYPVLLPLGLAVIIALVLEPAVNFAHRRGMPHGTATLGVCGLAVVVFLLFWAFLLPPLFGEAGTFFSKLPGWIDEGFNKLESLEKVEPVETVPAATTTNAPASGAPTVDTGAAPAPAPSPTRPRHSDFAVKYLRPMLSRSQFQDWMKQNLPLLEQSLEQKAAQLVSSAMGPVGQALGFALGFGFVPIYVYYFLADQDRIVRHWHDYVPLRDSPLRREIIAVLTEINEVLVKYFRGQIVVAAVDGLLTGIGLTIIGIPYSLMLGVMTGALSLVPFLGIIASILPALLLGFVYGHGLFKPIGVVVVFAAVQLIESMLVTPRVQSHSTGLHPLTIIIGILFWSMLLPGLLGPVVAVPLTCAIVVLLRRYVWQQRRGAVAPSAEK
jgi:predicted PurR-regulated permease PerM